MQPLDQIIVDKFEFLPVDGIKEGKKSKKLCIALEKFDDGNFGWPYSQDNLIQIEDLDNYQILKENFYSTYSCLYAAKNWPLMPLFSQFINQIFDYGIQDYYQKIVSKIEIFRYSFLKSFFPDSD